MKSLKTFGLLLKKSALQWNDHNALRLSAALSYYTVFSLAPLLLLATAIAGLALGEEAVHGELTRQLSFLLGQEGAGAVNELVASARKPSEGLFATLASIAALLIGATGVFAELKASLNDIWDAQPKKSTGVLGFLKDRLLSFAMVASIGFLLLVSMLVSTAISLASTFFSGLLPIRPAVLRLSYSAISLILTALMFALIFKVLPEKKILWREVWIGAILTSIVFTLGKFLIGLYLGSTGMLSSFGASGSIVLILVWTYYSSLILFFGAEFTNVYARRDDHERGT